jgi:hypothetical protein
MENLMVNRLNPAKNALSLVHGEELFVTHGSKLSKQGDRSFDPSEFEAHACNIMSRRPTRLSLELLSRAREWKMNSPAESGGDNREL